MTKVDLTGTEGLTENRRGREGNEAKKGKKPKPKTVQTEHFFLLKLDASHLSWRTPLVEKTFVIWRLR